MMYTQRGDDVFIWVTIRPETASLTPRTMNELKKVADEVNEHAMINWPTENKENRDIKLSKVDVACDFRGSFFPKANDGV